MADFVTSAIAHASDFVRSDAVLGSGCFKCRKRDDHRVETAIDDDDAVVWHCAARGVQGRIPNWQGTFWDLSTGRPSA